MSAESNRRSQRAADLASLGAELGNEADARARIGGNNSDMPEAIVGNAAGDATDSAGTNNLGEAWDKTTREPEIRRLSGSN